MDDLPSDVRSLIHRTRRHDGPNARDKERVSQKLGVALAAAGSAAGLLASKSVAAATAVASEGAAAATAVSATVAAVNAATVGTAVPVGGVAGAGTAVSAGVAAGTSVAAGAAAGIAAGTGAVAPVAIVATKWGGSSLAAWLIGASVVGAGATLGAPQVMQWVNTEPARIEQTRDVTENVAAREQAVAPRDELRPNVSAESLKPELLEVVVSSAASEVAASFVDAARETKQPTTPSAANATQPVEVAVRATPTKVTAANPTSERALSDNDPGAEVALLGQAQRALAAGDGASSLTLLSEHASRFPKSAFGVERSAARVFAFCQLGRVDEATAEARVFFRNGKGSPLTPRVQASCIKSSDTKDSSTNLEKAGN